MFVVVLVVRGDKWKMILNIAICHPHESTAWAACEAGEFLGCFEGLGLFCLYPGLY